MTFWPNNFGMAHGINMKFGLWTFHNLMKWQKNFDFIDFWLPYSLVLSLLAFYAQLFTHKHCLHISGLRTRDRLIWHFGADTAIWAINGSTPITDISKYFKSCFLLHFKKYNVFYAFPFLENFKNQDLWAEFFQIAAISIFWYDLQLIWLTC